jgi:hypothetical protein
LGFESIWGSSCHQNPLNAKSMGFRSSANGGHSTGPLLPIHGRENKLPLVSRHVGHLYILFCLEKAIAKRPAVNTDVIYSYIGSTKTERWQGRGCTYCSTGLNLRHHSKNGVGFKVLITVVMKRPGSQSIPVCKQVARQIIGWSLGLPPAFTMVSCSAYSRALKTEAICSSETSVNFQSQSHVTTAGQSVSMSWCQVHSGTCDQILFSVWKLLCSLCVAPSLTRGRVCLLSVTVSSI